MPHMSVSTASRVIAVCTSRPPMYRHNLTQAPGKYSTCSSARGSGSQRLRGLVLKNRPLCFWMQKFAVCVPAVSSLLERFTRGVDAEGGIWHVRIGPVLIYRNYRRVVRNHAGPTEHQIE